MFKETWEKIKVWFDKWVTTPFVGALWFASTYMGMTTSKESTNIFRQLMIGIVFGFASAYLAEKFIFTGWSLKDEIKKGNIAAALAFVGICIIVMGIVSKLIPSI